ncbi:MAG TPA: GNAT family N-acetyltransferase [Spirochaetota bacterium]
MIRKATDSDFDTMYEIINDAAIAYKGIIPADRWHEPYMPKDELREQIRDGVVFWCYEENGSVIGVMGIQDRGDVDLIRHAYVRTSLRKKGIGGQLLTYLCSQTGKPILIGTWADASWAVNFYTKHGFRVVDVDEKNRLLRRYWNIPERQVETSVVLANSDTKDL